MKLVDILARELKEWVSDWPAMGQAKDGTLHREPFLGGHTSFSLTRASDYVQAIVTRAQWQEARDALSKTPESDSVEEIDWSKADEGYDYHIRWPHKNMRAHFYRLDGDRYVRNNGYYATVADVAADPALVVTRRPGIEEPWNGEGLPPVGVRIEAKHKDADPGWARPDFYETEIVAIGKQLVIFEADGSGHEKVGKLGDYIFRPIRTPEQIAAEERSEFSYVMCKDAGHDSPTRGQLAMAEKLFDAGYRKVKGGEE